MTTTPVPVPVLRTVWLTYRDEGITSGAVYETVREAILSGMLPARTRLTEAGLADQLSISRTPVREALLRLENERFLERSARRGLVVGEVTVEDILEVYVVREAISGLAAGLAATAATPADIIGLRRLHNAMGLAHRQHDPRRMAEINLEFHEVICAASRNRLLLVLTREVHDTLRRFPGTTFSMPDRATAALREHESLIEAIAAHDAEAAEAIARSHMAQAMSYRIAMLEGTIDVLRRSS